MKKFYVTSAPRESNHTLVRFEALEEAVQIAEKELKSSKSSSGTPLEAGIRFVVEIVAVVERAEPPVQITRFR